MVDAPPSDHRCMRIFAPGEFLHIPNILGCFLPDRPSSCSPVPVEDELPCQGVTGVASCGKDRDERSLRMGMGAGSTQPDRHGLGLSELDRGWTQVPVGSTGFERGLTEV